MERFDVNSFENILSNFSRKQSKQNRSRLYSSDDPAVVGFEYARKT